MKCKSKLYSYLLTPLLCLFLVFSTYTMPTHASTTSGSEEGNVFERTEDYVRDNFSRLCRYVVRWNAVISDGIIGTWQDFTTWLDSSGNGDIWEQHPHSPIRTQNGVDNVEVPQEVLNVLNQYVIYQIQQNPLTYSECYIHTYSMVNVDWFPTYQLYQTWKSWASQQDGYILTKAYIANGSTQGIRACVIPKTNDINFVGTVTSGVFTNVSMYIGWSATNTPWTIASGSKWVEILNNGTIRDFNGAGQAASTLGNTTNIHDTTTSRMTIWSNLPKDELVYVFNSLSALKHYNAQSPQPYYLTSEGLSNSMSNWSVGSGTINTGTLSNANSSYSQVINNVQSGWTAAEVLALVDRISTQNNNGSGSGSDNESDDGWLDLGIFGDIGKAIAKVIGAIITAIASIFEEIIGIVTQVSETLLQGVIFEFLSAFIGWLPDEIVALLTALFSVAVLFALVKLIREAF